MNRQRIPVPSLSVGVSYDSPQLARLYAAIIITGSDGKALSDKDFADHLRTLSPLAYASYIEGHAIKPTPDNPGGFEKLTVFLGELPKEATGVTVVGYLLDDEVSMATLSDIQKLTVTIEPLEDTGEESCTPLVMSDEGPQTRHYSKILCEMRRSGDGTWELYPVDRPISSNQALNRQYGVLLDL